jgi:hypothetical protein
VKIYLGEALELLLKTLPFIWIRLGTYSLLGIALAIYFAIAGGIAWLLGNLFSILGVIVFVAAIGGAWAILQWVTRYFFYLLKAAHVAVMTEFIVYGQGPRKSQVAYGRKQVTDRFRDTSIMFAVDQIVDGVVRGFNRQFARVANLLPIPGLENLSGIIERVSLFAATYIDESILSRAYQYREKNVWGVAQDGVILYAQAWKPILLNAVALTLLSYVQLIVLLVIFAIPAILIGIALPFLKTFVGICALLGALMVKFAVFDAYCLAATLIAYHRAVEGLEPDPAWQERLESASHQFKQLQERAMEAMRSPQDIQDA